MDVYAGEQLVIRDVEVASTYFKRLRGMIRRPLRALFIPRCNSIHTYFMKKPIDVVFLDKGLQILHISKNVKPSRLRVFGKAAHVLELDAFLSEQMGLAEGHQLRFVHGSTPRANSPFRY